MCAPVARFLPATAFGEVLQVGQEGLPGGLRLIAGQVDLSPPHPREPRAIRRWRHGHDPAVLLDGLIEPSGVLVVVAAKEHNVDRLRTGRKPLHEPVPQRTRVAVPPLPGPDRRPRLQGGRRDVRIGGAGEFPVDRHCPVSVRAPVVGTCQREALAVGEDRAPCGREPPRPHREAELAAAPHGRRDEPQDLRAAAGSHPPVRHRSRRRSRRAGRTLQQALHGGNRPGRVAQRQPEAPFTLQERGAGRRGGPLQPGRYSHERLERPRGVPRLGPCIHLQRPAQVAHGRVLYESKQVACRDRLPRIRKRTRGSQRRPVGQFRGSVANRGHVLGREFRCALRRGRAGQAGTRDQRFTRPCGSRVHKAGKRGHRRLAVTNGLARSAECEPHARGHDLSVTRCRCQRRDGAVPVLPPRLRLRQYETVVPGRRGHRVQMGSQRKAGPPIAAIGQVPHD